MTITQIDHSTRAENRAKTDPLELKNEAQGDPGSEKFGHVMTRLKQAPSDSDGLARPLKAENDASEGLTAGQEVATSVQGLPVVFNVHSLDSGAWSLKAVNLGPTLNVITSEQAAPDDQSLEAFARSQGLDDRAIQWLMGNPEGLRLAPPSDALEASTSLSDTALSDGLRSGPAELNTDTGGTPLEAMAAMPPPVSAALYAALPVNAALAPAVLTTAAALWAMAPNDNARAATAAVPGDSAEAAGIQVQLLQQPTPAAFWMLRAAPTTESKPAWSTQTDTLSESELDLTADFSVEVLETLTAGAETTPSPAPMSSASHPVGVSGQRQDAMPMPATDTNASDPADPSASQASQRSENIQNLAEKMGQAVGRRILSELEKGQWHLKLQLRPATLGHIEVDMRMLSGELDAVFNAPQALTRELLQEGLSRLKDTLSQMGMDVASMQVKDGQHRQNGGNPTPKQSSNSSELTQNDSNLINSQPVQAIRQKMGEDGWDVLV